MAKQVMTPDHFLWDVFADRLSGPEGCDFKEDKEKGYTWKCAGGTNKTYATIILEDMGMDVEKSLAYFEQHGGYCDCEILFNVDPGAKG